VPEQGGYFGNVTKGMVNVMGGAAGVAKAMLGSTVEVAQMSAGHVTQPVVQAFREAGKQILGVEGATAVLVKRRMRVQQATVMLNSHGYLRRHDLLHGVLQPLVNQANDTSKADSDLWPGRTGSDTAADEGAKQGKDTMRVNVRWQQGGVSVIEVAKAATLAGFVQQVVAAQGREGIAGLQQFSFAGRELDGDSTAFVKKRGLYDGCMIQQCTTGA